MILTKTACSVFDVARRARQSYITAFPHIRHVCFILLTRCNLTCSYCDLWKGNEEQQLSFETMERLCRGLSHQPESFHLSGGEPFLREDIASLCDWLRGRYRKSKLIITTNGTLPDKVHNFLRTVQSYERMNLSMSLNGLEKEICTNQRTDHLVHFTETLRMLNRDYPRIPKTIKMVIGALNKEELYAAYRFADEHSCRLQLKFQEYACAYTNPVVTSPDGMFTAPPFMLNYVEADRALITKELQAFMRVAALKTYSIMDRLYLSQALRFLTSGDVPRSRCAAVGNYVMIMPDGSARPCRYLMRAYPHEMVFGSKHCVTMQQDMRHDPACLHPGSSCMGFWNFFI